MDFEEFCAAAISVHQLEGLQTWEEHARSAYELFDKDGNRPIRIEELASVHIVSSSAQECFSSVYCVSLCLMFIPFFLLLLL